MLRCITPLLLLALLLAPRPGHAAPSPEAQRGLSLLRGKGCLACHSTDGAKKVGPTLLGLFGARVTGDMGGERKTVTVDQAYLLRSIQQPNTDVRDGYAPNSMPVTPLTEGETAAIVAAIEYLASPEAASETPPQEGSLLWLFLGAFAFVFGHFILSSVPVRTPLIARMKLSGFQGAYALVAAANLTWLLVAYFNAPYVALWTPPLWTRWLPLAGMPIVMILMLGSFTPTSNKHGGMTAITRHPQLWAQGLWGLLHIPANGDVASVVLFGAFALLSFGGLVHIELRRGRDPNDEAWQSLVEVTSVMPLAALRRGDAHLVPKDLGFPVLLGLVTYALLLVLHEPLIGVSPFP